MKENIGNSQRIARNTVMLYLRMLFIMLISLYTSRVVLNTLGVENYGLYNVIGSFVALFTFINLSIATSVQRFLTYEIGRNDSERLNLVFNTALFINIVISILLILLGETVGYWFLVEKLSIPTDKLATAIFVYQLSLFACVFSVFTSTYIAVIIAYERMASYAFISMIESLLKLAVVYLLLYLDYDKLKLYALLIFAIQIIILLLYVSYCSLKFTTIRFSISFNKSTFMRMFGFSMWNVWGTMSYVICTQGINILLNIFVGPSLNAARAIAVQVQMAIQSFGNNFQQAINPQITKSYASNNLQYMHTLITSSSKYTFYLLLFISLPILLDTNLVLTWWLKIVPDHTVWFVRLMIVVSFIACTANPVMIAALSTGKIRLFQIIDSLILFLLFPASYILLTAKYPPELIFVLNILVECLMFIARIIIIFPQINMSWKKYLYDAIFPILLVTIISVTIPIILSFYFSSSILGFTLLSLISFFSVGGGVYFLGLKQIEKELLQKQVLHFLKVSFK